MLTLFSNASFLQHYDVICILDRLQAMGNHDYRTSCNQCIDGTLYFHFIFRIE